MEYLSLQRLSLAVILWSVLFANVSLAQTDNVGIGTFTPEPSAILDVANPYDPISGTATKGMLVPRVSQIERLQMQGVYNDTLANGLIVYEREQGIFWYYRYDNPVPATAPFGSWVQLLSQIPANAAVPQGGIMMWSGTIASIPVGWALCDGANGTPDLTDKFIISVTSALENPGTAPVPNQFVTISGTQTANDKRFFKLAYIMKL